MLSDHPVRPPRLLYPGSFDPVHAGHLGVARIAAELVGVPLDFEISLRNVEKGTLDDRGLEERITRLRRVVAREPRLGHLWLTTASTFVEKAQLFRSSTFVVGLDTYRRIADPRFYEGVGGIDHGLQSIIAASCRFLVFFRHLDDVDRWDDPGSYPRILASVTQFVPRDRYADPDKLASRNLRAESARWVVPPPIDR